jgi:hypothetical protein
MAAVWILLDTFVTVSVVRGSSRRDRWMTDNTSEYKIIPNISSHPMAIFFTIVEDFFTFLNAFIVLYHTE